VEALNVQAIGILWLRELKRYARSPAQIVGSLGQPMLYLVALGFGLGPVFQQAGQGSYLQFVAPGVIGMSVLFSSIFSGIGLLWDRQFGFLKETLVAPVPRLHIMIGRTLGSATVAFMQGTLVLLLCIVAGFRPAHVSTIPMAFMFMAMICVVFSALGTAIGSTLQNMQGFQMIMGFLVMPIFFLSGALYPLRDLPVAMVIATRIDPLTYGIDGLRGAFLGTSQFAATTNFLVLVAIAAAFTVFGAYRFSKIQV
jgi:ABC-2 type transport system permease protein